MTNEGTICVVMGTTGEYSDRTEWPVCAYIDEQQAQRHVELASSWVREHWLDDWSARRELKNPYDPGMHTDYTGTSYYTMTVPVRVSAPGKDEEQ